VWIKEKNMAITRLDIKLDQKIKDKATKASVLLNKRSLTEYIVQLIDEDATRVIAQHATITVDNDILDRFILDCDEAKKPNKTLLDAVTFTREKGVD
jgi:uncharacterized protein (DUF1778 family)